MATMECYNILVADYNSLWPESGFADESRRLWLGLGYWEAKATSGQAKASGFQAKPSQNNTSLIIRVLSFAREHLLQQ